MVDATKKRNKTPNRYIAVGAATEFPNKPAEP